MDEDFFMLWCIGTFFFQPLCMPCIIQEIDGVHLTEVKTTTHCCSLLVSVINKVGPKKTKLRFQKLDVKLNSDVLLSEDFEGQVSTHLYLP